MYNWYASSSEKSNINTHNEITGVGIDTVHFFISRLQIAQSSIEMLLDVHFRVFHS